MSQRQLAFFALRSTWVLRVFSVWFLSDQVFFPQVFISRLFWGFFLAGLLSEIDCRYWDRSRNLSMREIHANTCLQSKDSGLLQAFEKVDRLHRLCSMFPLRTFYTVQMFVLVCMQLPNRRHTNSEAFQGVKGLCDVYTIYTRDGQPMAHAPNLAHWMIWSGALYTCNRNEVR